MKHIIFSILSFLLFIQRIACASLEGGIEFPADATNFEKIQTEIQLIEVSSDPAKIPFKQNTNINANGQFKFINVPEGSYVLSVSSVKFNLQPFKTRIDVDSDNQVKAYFLQATQDFNDIAVEVPIPMKFIVNPTNPRRSYIKKRSTGILESGPVKTVLNNPLYLGGAVLALAVIIGPTLMEKFDPETARFMQESRAQKQGKANVVTLPPGIAPDSLREAKESKSQSSEKSSTTSTTIKNRKKKA